ncbi:MAG: hypothetical protein IPP37_07060 [Saprospiraceae bacterium]|nr:hypothetical protein [Saprospiraceae bacterium]
MEYNEIVLLIIIYLLGYLIEAVSSIVETPILFRLFGKNPAENLLDGKKCFGIGISREGINEIFTNVDNQLKEDKLELFFIFIA